MTETSTQRPIGEIEPEPLAQRPAAEGSPARPDVRESWEVAAAHRAGAVHIPMGALPACLLQAGGFGSARPQPGNDSLLPPRDSQPDGGQWLAAQGFKKVFNLSGGIDAWSMRMDPRVPRY